LDELLVVDAGFPCPDGVELIDIALAPGKPSVLEVLAEIAAVHSVEKVVLAQETRQHNPTHFEKAAAAFGKGVAVEEIPHADLKQRSRSVKTIVRTGDFTAWGNVLLVSGAGPRWQMER
jgi:D-ribose pyranase